MWGASGRLLGAGSCENKNLESRYSIKMARDLITRPFKGITTPAPSASGLGGPNQLPAVDPRLS